MILQSTKGHRRSLTFRLMILVMSLTFCRSSMADDQLQPRKQAWTSSRVMGSPDPPLPYVSERAFPNLKFKDCVDLVTTSSSNRWFLVEQFGKIFSFEKRDEVAQADLVVDFAKSIPGVEQTYSLAFHPNFANNRYCYVCYIKAPDLKDGTCVSRFTMSTTNPPTIDVSTEQTLVTWYSGGHNGCHLLFGPDGYLYISAGDANAANPPDIFKTGQDLSDIPASILRLDVDSADDGRNYRIPPDNPFVGRTGVREEIWAYGLRNPWRMSFDRQTRDLWCGDVGWEVWEMLHRIERGGNYGWSIMEAHQPMNTSLKQGPTPILPPITVHPHTESTSITEGLTYYGKRLEELAGTHIYSDYDTGKFWCIRYADGKVQHRRELADTTHRVVSFGEDVDGEFYFLDHIAGTIHRLVPNPAQGRENPFPKRLSQTGLFSSVSDHTPAPGVFHFSIAAEPWADSAMMDRFVAIPGDHRINNQPANWIFPKDSVLVKSLSLETRMGDPSSRRPIETQLLHFDGNDWIPYTYQWNEDRSDAVLVGSTGAQLDIQIESQSGELRTYPWRFMGRAECQRCHNKYSGTVLGFNAPQLYQRGEDNQLDQLAALGIFSSNVSDKAQWNVVNPHDTTLALDSRARSYLHVNCSHCHRMSAGGAVASYMHFDLTLEQTNMLATPTQGNFEIPAAKVIAPGDPLSSVLIYRMSKLGGGRMPRLGCLESDVRGIALISQWIAEMGSAQSPEILDSRRHIEASIQQLSSADRLESYNDIILALLSSTSGAMALQQAIDAQRINPVAVPAAVRLGSSHRNEIVRDLFERFLPADQRVKRLGTFVSADSILALQGNVSSGRQLMLETASVSCRSCHQIAKQGLEVGPDLTQIGSKLTAAQILESILEPSKQIDPKYRSLAIETKDGNIVAGIVVRESAAELVIRTAKNEQVTIARLDIEQASPSVVSLMPEQLVSELTAQQLADIVAFLSTLKTAQEQ